MAVVPSKINSDHRSAPTRQTQRCGRQRVKRVLRLQRMANRPTSDQALPKKVQCRSVCITPNGPPSNLETWKPDPGATYTDAMTLNWSLLKGYAFPPFFLIGPVLKKVSQDKADLVLVAPVWQAQPWWPALLNLLIRNPTMIPNSKHLLGDPAFPLKIHPMYPRLHLAVFQLSGNNTKQKGFQRTLPKFCNQQLVPPHIRHTSQPGDYGIAGVLNGKLIQFQPHSTMSFSS